MIASATRRGDLQRRWLEHPAMIIVAGMEDHGRSTPSSRFLETISSAGWTYEIAIALSTFVPPGSGSAALLLVGDFTSFDLGEDPKYDAIQFVVKPMLYNIP